MSCNFKCGRQKACSAWRHLIWQSRDTIGSCLGAFPTHFTHIQPIHNDALTRKRHDSKYNVHRNQAVIIYPLNLQVCTQDWKYVLSSIKSTVPHRSTSVDLGCVSATGRQVTEPDFTLRRGARFHRALDTPT